MEKWSSQASFAVFFFLKLEDGTLKSEDLGNATLFAFKVDFDFLLYFRLNDGACLVHW